MSAKVGLVSCAISSEPSSDGTGKFFIESITITKFIATLIITSVIGYFFGGMIGIFGVIGGMFGGGLLSIIGKKNFKIATGDVLGASNEIGRLFSLLFMLLIISLF
jgi:adenosylcobinamide-GDP ribazoletransferase